MISIRTRLSRNDFILVLFLPVVFACGCGESVSSLNRTALESLAKSDFGEAERLLSRAIEKEPTQKVLRQNLAEVFFRQAKWDEAIGHLKKALSISGWEKDVDLNKSLVEALLAQGRPDLAWPILSSMTSQENEDEYLLFLYGYCSQSPNTAINYLEKALEKNPDRKESYFALARAQAWKGDLGQALDTLERLTNRFGESTDTVLYNIALHLRETDTTRAKQILAASSNEVQSNPLARLFEAYIHLVDRKAGEAQQVFQEIENEPEVSIRARLGDAFCYLIQDDPNEAISICDTLLAEEPSEVIAYNLRGLAQLKRLQRFLAKKSFESSLVIDPNQPTIRALVDQIN